CVSELIGSSDPGLVAYTGGLILAGKLLAWGLGGIAFGVVADRIGRAKTMMITVVIYSVFTGLSGLAESWWQLMLFQALAGVGIGGEWAAGTALVAETWPERGRQRALVGARPALDCGSRHPRKKIEMVFAHLKRILKLDRLRLRGPNGARDEFILAATARNLRKLAKLIPLPKLGPA